MSEHAYLSVNLKDIGWKVYAVVCMKASWNPCSWDENEVMTSLPWGVPKKAHVFEKMAEM